MLPEEQQDREQHDKQTEGNTTCAYQKRPFWASPASTQLVAQSASYIAELIGSPQDRCKRTWLDPSLAEKPKVGELQMNWLRSEDLKEEKNVTTPIFIVAGQPVITLGSFTESVARRARLQLDLY